MRSAMGTCSAPAHKNMEGLLPIIRRKRKPLVSVGDALRDAAREKAAEVSRARDEAALSVRAPYQNEKVATERSVG